MTSSLNCCCFLMLFKGTRVRRARQLLETCDNISFEYTQILSLARQNVRSSMKHAECRERQGWADCAICLPLIIQTSAPTTQDRSGWAEQGKHKNDNYQHWVSVFMQITHPTRAKRQHNTQNSQETIVVGPFPCSSCLPIPGAGFCVLLLLGSFWKILSAKWSTCSSEGTHNNNTIAHSIDVDLCLDRQHWCRRYPSSIAADPPTALSPRKVGPWFPFPVIARLSVFVVVEMPPRLHPVRER